MIRESSKMWQTKEIEHFFKEDPLKSLGKAIKEKGSTPQSEGKYHVIVVGTHPVHTKKYGGLNVWQTQCLSSPNSTADLGLKPLEWHYRW